MKLRDPNSYMDFSNEELAPHSQELFDSSPGALLYADQDLPCLSNKTLEQKEEI